MPPSASSMRPRRRSVAPVNAPFSWPNSSLSSSVSVSAAQLTATNGPAARLLWAWIARATTSLPVPLSPLSRTVAWVGATRPIAATTGAIVGSPQVRRGASTSRAARSRAETSARRSTARATRRRSSVRLDTGFCR